MAGYDAARVREAINAATSSGQVPFPRPELVASVITALRSFVNTLDPYGRLGAEGLAEEGDRERCAAALEHAQRLRTLYEGDGLLANADYAAALGRATRELLLYTEEYRAQSDDFTGGAVTWPGGIGA